MTPPGSGGSEPPSPPSVSLTFSVSPEIGNWRERLVANAPVEDLRALKLRAAFEQVLTKPGPIR